MENKILQNEVPQQFWKHNINPITGFGRASVRLIPYEPKVYKIPVRNKNKFSN